MAVSTVNRIAGPYLGDGVATVFPFAFKVFTASDLSVLSEDAGGNISTLVLGSDYTAAVNANQDLAPGGTVTLSMALVAGYRMIITSNIAQLQQVILTNLGGFFPDVLNGEFDRLTILVQQLQLLANQSLRLSLLDDLSSAELPSAPARANKLLGFGSDGAVSLLSTATVLTGVLFFSGPLLGTKDGTNRVFSLTNSGSALGETPIQATVWKNFPLILNDPNGYAYGPLPGQVTFAVAPDPTDSLSASGVFSL